MGIKAFFYFHTDIMAHFIDSLNGELLFAVRKMIVKRTFRRTAFFNNLIQPRAVIPLKLKQPGCRGEDFSRESP